MQQAHPPPLPAHTVSLILQYILPPSQISEPLPPHLLSAALLQRHHFLTITPDDAQSYLCWPSSTSEASAVDVLESLPRPPDDHLEGLDTTYSVEYSADDEHVYAYATIKAGQVSHPVRLVFQWDGADSWKYHDARMSLASQTIFDNPSAAIQAVKGAEAGQVDRYPVVTLPGRPHPDDDASGDDDDYWNAYGGADDDEPRVRSSSKRSSIFKDTGEDAYWAQYSTVQGTADSTVPSPLPLPRRPGNRPHPHSHLSLSRPTLTWARPPGLSLPFASHLRPERISVPSSSLSHLQPVSPRRDDPPSPNVLRKLLEAIPPRPNGIDHEDADHALLDHHATDISVNEASVKDLSIVNGGLELAGAEDMERVNEDDQGTVHAFSPRNADFASAPVSLATTTAALPAPLMNGKGNISGIHTSPSAVDIALKQSISGIFQLWRAGAPGTAHGNASEVDMFLNVVRDALVAGSSVS